MPEEIIKTKNICNLCGKPLIKKGEKTAEIKAFPAMKTIYHKRCWLKTKKEEEINCLIFMSCRSIGDTISITPCIREFKRIYPKINLDIVTTIPEVFKYNTNLRKVIPYNKDMKQAFLQTYDASWQPFQPDNKNFPLHMLTHSVDFVSYGMFRKFLKPQHKHYEINYTYIEANNCENICKHNNIYLKKDKILLIHPNSSEWKTRTWKTENWQKLVNLIQRDHPDYKLVSVGGDRDIIKEIKTQKMDNHVVLDNCIDMYNKLSLLETIHLMNNSKMLISMDTGAIHIAGATDIHIFGIFTVVNSQYRLPYFKGELGYNCTAIDSEECDCCYDQKILTEILDINECPKKYDELKCHPSVNRVWDKLTRLL